MKNNNINKIILGLFVLLFINTSVNAQDVTLPNFTRFKRQGDFTCWATSTRMVMSYYGLAQEEDVIVKRAFDLQASLPAPVRANSTDATGILLQRLLLPFYVAVGASSLARSNVVNMINDGRPVIASKMHFDENNNQVDVGHQYVIIGYRLNGNDMMLYVADPRNDNEFSAYPYNQFLRDTSIISIIGG